MMQSKADILSRLQKEILALQGFKPASLQEADSMGLGRINAAFPNRTFPLSSLHEFCCSNVEELSASGGFVAGILSSLVRKGSAALWITASQKIFPPALKAFGIQPEQIIFLELKKEKDILWAMEEALKCHALAAVVGELKEMSFTASRRLQLAIEKSGVPCFVLRQNPKNMATTSVARWQVKPVRSSPEDELPGVAHPRWRVSLLKVRNGHTGCWEIEWMQGRFRHVSKMAILHQERQKKTG